MPFGDEAAEGQCLTGRPVETFAALEHLRLGVEYAAQRLVDVQIFGNRRQRPAETVEQLTFYRCVDITARGFSVRRLVQAAPPAGEPVCLVRLVAGGGVEFLGQMVAEFRLQRIEVVLGDDAFIHQAPGVEDAHLVMRADAVIHQRLGEAGFVAFIVTEAAIAPHVDHDVAAELLAIFNGQLAGEGHGFRIVAIHMQDRRLNTLGHIAGVRARTRELRAGREADLVVDDEVDAAAGVVAAHTRKAEAFPDDALTREGRIAVDQHWQNLFVLFQIVADRLLRACLAENHRVHRFQVAGVRNQAHMHLDTVELAVGAGAEMVLHIARTADIVGIGASTLEFMEDDLVRLAHDIRENVEPPPVRHAVNNLANALMRAVFDHRFQRRDHAFAAVQAEALGADILLAEKFLELFAAHDR